MPTPKRAGADLHRDEPQPESESQPEPGVGQADGQATETVAAEELGGGRMGASGGESSSMIPNISNKRLLMIGGILLVGLFAYYQVRRGDDGDSGGDGDGDSGDGGDPDFEPNEEQPDDGMPNIEQDPTDPLKADEQAIDVIWGDE